MAKTASNIDSALKLLAIQIAQRLSATPAPDPPARAVFAAGVIYLNLNEIAIEFTNIGYFFVKDVGGQVVIEGVVIRDLERTEKRRRHQKLRELGKKIFGDDMIIRDPLGRGAPAGRSSIRFLDDEKKSDS